MKKDNIIQTGIIIVAIAFFAAGIYFIVQLVNGPGGGEKSSELSSTWLGTSQTYTHPDYGFTLNYPANLKFGKFPEGEGEVVLLQGSDGKQGLQIFVSLYEEENTLSKAIIQESVPDLKISNDREIELGSDPATELGAGKIKALSFDSTGADSGDTHEIWFVQDGNLYQVTSYRDFGDEMEEIIKTIRFN